MVEQKVTVVTGVSSGIERTTAIALAKVGNKIVLAARREKEGEETPTNQRFWRGRHICKDRCLK